MKLSDEQEAQIRAKESSSTDASAEESKEVPTSESNPASNDKKDDLVNRVDQINNRKGKKGSSR